MVLTMIDNEEDASISSLKLSKEMNDFECSLSSHAIVLQQTLNPTQGKKEWVVQSDNYDYMQEIARSAYADMLHDDERNELFFKGIRDAVSLLKSRGETVRVLDIGTGTGLLSMMSVECGADVVTACEGFDPMAHCAKKIIRANHMDSKIKVIGKRSNHLHVGLGLDMEERANLLVAELLDTELIGEGAILAYNHAMEHLMTKDAILVPSSATIYAQVVHSPLLHSFSKPYTNVPSNSKDNIKLPTSFDKCAGSISVHDIQMSQLPLDSFTPISKPLKIFEFDWSGRSSALLTKQSKTLKFEATEGELVGHCVFMWWDATMDQKGENTLTCAPYWQQKHTDGTNVPGPHSVPWRDHWMQAVYHLPPPHLQVTQGQNLYLTGVRDAFSMWFSLSQTENSPPPPAPYCSCGIHHCSPRQRIAQLSDVTRSEVYQSVMERTLATKSTPSAWLLLGDGVNLVTLGLLTQRDKVCQVYVHVSTDRERGIVKEFIQENEFKGKVTILPENLAKLTRQDIKFEIDVVFSEPFFSTSILPWHNLRTNFLLKEARHLLTSPTDTQGSSLSVLPGKLEVYALPVCFLNLWKIRASCYQRCGFNLLHFDELISKARKLSDEYIEAQPLWEYPCFPLSSQIHLCTLDLSEDLSQKNLSETGSLELDLQVYRDSIVTSAVQKELRKSVYGAMSRRGDEEACAYYNGVVLWTKWVFGPHLSTSCGPTEEITPGKLVSWDMLSQQAVHLPNVSTPLLEGDKRVIFSHQTTVENGELSFSFSLDKH